MFKYFKVLNDSATGTVPVISTVAVLRKASTFFFKGGGGGLLYTFNWIIVDIVLVTV